ncbi:branched-chain amino acid ABC transporter permease [Pseudochelatococcus lubricantis]|uniref:branched-chain amino acid ABC transporter permease n=1 Tax=Pseudochelatococcus lubricantis TaxID=1538102 RepID=UPI0035E8361A
MADLSLINPDRQSRLLASAQRFVPALVLVVALVGILAYAQSAGDTFLIRVFTRIMIFGIVAVALNFVLGFGGMVSLMHASFIGVGGYVVAILAYHDANLEPLMIGPFAFTGTSDLAILLPLAIVVTVPFAALTGLISLRTSGTYFIMITLAFNQMAYYFFVALQAYGGEDGLQIINPITFGGLDLSQRSTFYLFTLSVLALTLVLVTLLVDSKFGIVLRAAAQNERRLSAIGIAPLRYKLLAFVISGTLTGMAGVLLATGQQFISPADMSWSRSGELVVMVVMGGLGSVSGPLVGAAVYLGLELILESWTEYWHLAFGLLIVAMVTLLRGGIADLGALVPWLGRNVSGGKN